MPVGVAVGVAVCVSVPPLMGPSFGATGLFGLLLEVFCVLLEPGGPPELLSLLETRLFGVGGGTGVDAAGTFQLPPSLPETGLFGVVLPLVSGGL